MKDASLDKLRDLNIIVGPNNSGKTSLLKAISLLSELSFDPGSIDCDVCRRLAEKDRIPGVRAKLEETDKFLKRKNVKISYSLYKGFVANALEKGLEEYQKNIDDRKKALNEILDRIQKHTAQQFDRLNLTSRGNELWCEHLYINALPNWREKIFQLISNKTLLCPEERLQNYKKAEIHSFLKGKDLETAVISSLLLTLKKIVDPRICDIKTGTMSIVQDFDGIEHIASIAEQGSGLKSLVCLCCDILTAKDAKTLLVDEPELGLNPAGKKAFLEFLLNQAAEKQVFIATHDPTFLNPIIWKNQPDVAVGVYLYSQSTNGFVTVDVTSEEDEPSCFAGFLPQTTSMKEYRIFVEGKYDVPVFQIFLNRFLEKNQPDLYNRYVLRNKVEIFHLRGEQWEHFINTVPSEPFKSLIIFDGDKKPIITSKLEKKELKRFELIRNIRDWKYNEFASQSGELKVPIYCLEKEEIEDYLREGTNQGNKINKRENVTLASQIELPEEIKEIFARFLPKNRGG